MGPHRGSLRWIPPRGIKKIQGSKKDDYQPKNEVQKTSSWGRYKIERDSNWDRIGDHYVGSATGDKNSRGQKRTITSSKNEIKKLFVGEEIKQKETQMGSHRGSLTLDPATWDKKFLGSKKDDYQLKIKIK